jgi:hypothetical protein
MERQKKYIHIFDRELEGSTKPRRRWMNSIKMDLNYIMRP